MFAVDHILVSDAVLDAPFACHLGRCLGGCCVHGDRGAPLEPDERDLLDAALPHVRGMLRPEALAVIETQGVWEGSEPEQYATTTVGGRECVFVIFDGKVATCALHRAHAAGTLAFQKPISCHLFPLRRARYGDTEVLNYEQIDLCTPAIAHGQATNSTVPTYLRAPLVRAYGEGWYARFLAACQERRAALRQP